MLIIEDCREGAPATGKTGIYEGDFPVGVYFVLGEDVSQQYSFDKYEQGTLWLGHLPARFHFAITGRNMKAAMDAAERPVKECYPIWQTGTEQPAGPCAMTHDNPRIRLDDGSVIWGYQCWWRSLEEEPAHDMTDEQANLETTKGAIRDLVTYLAEEIA